MQFQSGKQSSAIIFTVQNPIAPKTLSPWFTWATTTLVLCIQLLDSEWTWTTPNSSVLIISWVEWIAELPFIKLQINTYTPVSVTTNTPYGRVVSVANVGSNHVTFKDMMWSGYIGRQTLRHVGIEWNYALDVGISWISNLSVKIKSIK